MTIGDALNLLEELLGEDQPVAIIDALEDVAYVARVLEDGKGVDDATWQRLIDARGALLHEGTRVSFAGMNGWTPRQGATQSTAVQLANALIADDEGDDDGVERFVSLSLAPWASDTIDPDIPTRETQETTHGK